MPTDAQLAAQLQREEIAARYRNDQPLGASLGDTDPRRRTVSANPRNAELVHRDEEFARKLALEEHIRSGGTELSYNEMLAQQKRLEREMEEKARMRHQDHRGRAGPGTSSAATRRTVSANAAANAVALARELSPVGRNYDTSNRAASQGYGSTLTIPQSAPASASAQPKVSQELVELASVFQPPAPVLAASISPAITVKITRPGGYLTSAIITDAQNHAGYTIEYPPGPPIVGTWAIQLMRVQPRQPAYVISRSNPASWDFTITDPNNPVQAVVLQFRSLNGRKHAMSLPHGGELIWTRQPLGSLTLYATNQVSHVPTAVAVFQRQPLTWIQGGILQMAAAVSPIFEFVMASVVAMEELDRCGIPEQ
ncbi:hypothetical protein BJ742DRAFT_188516 [Cladochytrium replicatum]|nr:hypothetical protein BJ742DRAFT_188516 [Cladochytrium replicatum]